MKKKNKRKKRMSSIYSNPYKYAYECDVPIELARAVCKYQRRLENMRYRATKCPVCKDRALEFEGGSYEEGYDDYIYCDSCGEAFDVGEITHGWLLHGWSDFDVILWYSSCSTKKENWIMRDNELEITTIEEWHNWAWQQYRRCL